VSEDIDWKDVARLTHEQDQDVENGLKWWRETPDHIKLAVWMAIQKQHANAIDETISRLAQVGMTHIALLAETGSAAK